MHSLEVKSSMDDTLAWVALRGNTCVCVKWNLVSSSLVLSVCKHVCHVTVQKRFHVFVVVQIQYKNYYYYFYNIQYIPYDAFGYVIVGA